MDAIAPVMFWSNEKAEFAKAFLAAQKEIEFAAKDANNPHFKAKYADLPAVIEAVKPALNKAGIIFFQQPYPASRENHVGIRTTLMHVSGQYVYGDMEVPFAKADPQGFGSALTYTRRYALSSITGVYADVDDDGNKASFAPGNLPEGRTQVGGAPRGQTSSDLL